MCWFWTLQWLLLFITNNADSGPYSDYRYTLPLTITCHSADPGPLNDCLLPLIIYWGWFWIQQWLLVAITNSADSGPYSEYISVTITNSVDSWQYITIMNDYSIPLNTMSADCGPFNDHTLPLCLISKCSFGTLQQPVDHHSSDNSDNNSLIKFSSVTMETVNVSVRDLLTVFVPYLEILTLPSYFLPVFSPCTFLRVIQLENWPFAWFYHIYTVLLIMCFEI